MFYTWVCYQDLLHYPWKLFVNKPIPTPLRSACGSRGCQLHWRTLQGCKEWVISSWWELLAMDGQWHWCQSWSKGSHMPWLGTLIKRWKKMQLTTLLTFGYNIFICNSWWWLDWHHGWLMVNLSHMVSSNISVLQLGCHFHMFTQYAGCHFLIKEPWNINPGSDGILLGKWYCN